MFYFDAEKQSTGTYATVWSVEQDKNGFVKGRITTSEKDKEGNYTNSSWFVTFGKNISEKALTLAPSTRILMDKFSIKNPSKKRDDGSFVNYLGVNIYHFSIIEGNSTGNASTGSGFPKPEPPINKIKEKDVPTSPAEDAPLPFDI